MLSSDYCKQVEKCGSAMKSPKQIELSNERVVIRLDVVLEYVELFPGK